MSRWLTIGDVEQLLHVPEATIYRWIRQGDIPCIVRRGKHYFNKSTIVSWAESKHIHLEKNTSRNRNKNKSAAQPHLIEALKAGNVCQTVPSDSLEELFQEVAERMDLPQPITVSLAEQLMQREQLSSTGIGKGIAIPHPSITPGKQITQSMVGIFFLETPLDFKAPDGVPVFVVFVLLSADSFHHLQLLSQMAHFLSHPKMNDFLKHSPSLDNIVDQFQKTLAETTQ